MAARHWRVLAAFVAAAPCACRTAPVNAADIARYDRVAIVVESWSARGRALMTPDGVRVAVVADALRERGYVVVNSRLVPRGVLGEQPTSDSGAAAVGRSFGVPAVFVVTTEPPTSETTTLPGNDSTFFDLRSRRYTDIRVAATIRLVDVAAARTVWAATRFALAPDALSAGDDAVRFAVRRVPQRRN